MSASATSTRPAGQLTLANAALAAVTGAVGGAILSTIVVLIAKALGAPDDAMQLQPATYIPLVVIGVIAGTIGWYVTAKRSANPRQVLGKLVPAVMIVLFVPDIALGFSDQATWGTAIALMVMHVAVAAAALPAYLRFLSLSR
jgi:Family of unknown function (DUF6069)